MDQLFKALPFLLLAYGWYSTYIDLEAHQEQVTSLRDSVIPAKRTRVTRMEKEISEIEEFRSEIANYEQQIQDYRQQFVDIKTKIPPIDDKTDILDELNNEARKIKIQDLTFTPKYEKENNDGIYFTNGIEVSGKGTYLQLLVFFERLSLANRVYNINSLTVKNDTAKQTGRHRIVDVKTVIETFHYNSDYSPNKKEEKNKVRR